MDMNSLQEQKLRQSRCAIIGSLLFEPELAAGASGTTYLSGGVPVDTAAKADVYPLIAVGRDSYAFTPLAGKDAATVSVLNPKPSNSDPLGLVGKVGWKAWMAGAILQDAWLAVVSCAATAKY
ncbi:MAG: hypothetical protein EOM54_10940 [Clostridia bacterium]|nr:hypothetical protein [Clostridia bacterium]